MKNGWYLSIVSFLRWILRDHQSTKVEAFVLAFSNSLTGADIDVHLEGCIGCGACGPACNWFAGINSQPLHPKNKADASRRVYRRFMTISGVCLGRLGFLATPSESDLQTMAEKMFSSCTMCGRCMYACPQGVCNRRLTWLFRSAATMAGFQPAVIADIEKNCRTQKHSFGLDWAYSMGKVISLAAQAGIEIPIDRQGSEFLVVCSAIVNTKMPEATIDALKIFEAAGISYTVSSELKDTGTEAVTTVVSEELGKQFVEAVAREAARLGCKSVIIGECGCDMRTFHIEAAEVFGRYGVKVAYIDSLILELIEDGVIAVKPLEMTATYHDPCWAGRLTGYFEVPRRLLERCVTNFVEITPNRQLQICCNGGGGQMRMWPINNDPNNLRRKASALKAAQIRATSAETVVTPCATCLMSIRDTVAYHHVNVDVEQLLAIVLAAMENAKTNSTLEAVHA